MIVFRLFWHTTKAKNPLASRFFCQVSAWMVLDPRVCCCFSSDSAWNFFFCIVVHACLLSNQPLIKTVQRSNRKQRSASFEARKFRWTISGSGLNALRSRLVHCSRSFWRAKKVSSPWKLTVWLRFNGKWVFCLKFIFIGLEVPHRRRLCFVSLCWQRSYDRPVLQVQKSIHLVFARSEIQFPFGRISESFAIKSNDAMILWVEGRKKCMMHRT